MNSSLSSTTARLNLDILPEKIWDVAVIGAGPAGSSCALRLAKLGHAVLLIEAKAFPRDKVCGGCLNGRAVANLAELGIDSSLSWRTWRPLSRFELSCGGKRVAIALPGGAAVERCELDQMLVDRATSTGVSFLPRTRATVLPATDAMRQLRLTSVGVERIVQARIVISACGLGNHASSSLDGHHSITQEDSRIGLETILYSSGQRWAKETIYMHVGPEGYVGVTRLDESRLHLAAAVDREAVRRYETPTDLIQHLIESSSGILGLDGNLGDWSGTQPLTCRAERTADTRLFVIGDAAGYVEPFTGEGIRWALDSAREVTPLAARAISNWSDHFIDDWDSWNRKRLRREQRLCRTIAWTLRRRQLTAIAMSLLRVAPWSARPVVRALNKES